MTIIYESEIPNPDALFIRDPDPQICDRQGRKALRLSGQGACLLVIPDLILSQGWIEVDISTEGAAYPGIAFRILDSLNYELAYAQPHTSGKWDALQYDPVFHGSNTWQLYFGSGAQKNVEVPSHSWFRLQAKFQDQRAMIQVGEKEPLIVNRLAHNHHSGLVGLWTYLPAYFSNLRIGDEPPKISSSTYLGSIESPATESVTEWFLEGFGVVDTEPSGILNLNRYLPISEKTVCLIRQFEVLEKGKLTINVGFSDELTLKIDDDIIFQGQNLYHDSPKWEERGYVSPDQRVSCHLSKEVHQLTAILKSKEDFGFGMVLNIEGDSYTLLPAHLSKERQLQVDAPS